MLDANVGCKCWMQMLDANVGCKCWMQMNVFSIQDIPFLTTEYGDEIEYDSVFYRTDKYSLKKSRAKHIPAHIRRDENLQKKWKESKYEELLGDLKKQMERQNIRISEIFGKEI
jgi:hypothetical protein